jgi:signal transduction histidine kinase
MKIKHLKNKRKSIILKIFGVILALALSMIMFIMAFWGIIVSKPSSAGAHIHLALTLIVLISVGFLVASFIIRKILKPLSILNEAVEKVGKGNLDQVIPITNNDELGALSEAFNQMTAELKKMILAREQLLLDVSHELRSPITRAKLALEMMPDSPGKESINGDLKEMETMVTELLESERIKSGAFKPNQIPVKVEALLLKVMLNYHRDQNRIILFPVESSITIKVDENLIMSVIRNVIDNSLKYSPVQSKPIEITVISHQHDTTIQVEDFGQGIPEDKLPYVFEPFYRADQSRSRQTGGYGLGLHICKRIMDLHGAEIKLKNKQDNAGIITTLTFKKEN